MKHYDVGALFNEARKRDAYWVEKTVLEFTEDIVARMELQGLNRAGLAARIGTTPAYVTKILRGTSNFTLQSMVKISRALGCELRTHLQPAGARSRWFDVHEPLRSVGAEFQSGCELKSKLAQYTDISLRHHKENKDDHFALAS